MKMERVFELAKEASFERVKACCEGVPNKLCSTDLWKGNLGAFVAAVMKDIEARNNEQT